ncbi:MAG: SMI1/KNR4 family protein [Lachnospiraceae bacterium]|nr:SMI1/KNR4 family protein [Lachnospiraceae bacterium]
MDAQEIRSVIKKFFETLYEKMKDVDEVLVKIPVVEGNEPMWEEGCVPDEEEWVTWRLLKAQVDDKEIAALEEEIGVKLPQVLKIFLTTYYHYFDGVGRNPVENKFEGILGAWNPMLVRNGYLPFAWDAKGYFIRCMDLANMPEEEKCPIVQIDHEVMFDFDEDHTGREELEEVMEPVAENFFAFLNAVLNGEEEV